jgi:hypothetical protein
MAGKKLERNRKRKPQNSNAKRRFHGTGTEPGIGNPGDCSDHCAQYDRADDVRGLVAQSWLNQRVPGNSVQHGQNHQRDPYDKGFDYHLVSRFPLAVGGSAVVFFVSFTSLRRDRFSTKTR